MWPDGGYVMQRDEEVKSTRPVALVAGRATARPYKIAGDRSADTLL